MGTGGGWQQEAAGAAADAIAPAAGRSAIPASSFCLCVSSPSATGAREPETWPSGIMVAASLPVQELVPCNPICRRGGGQPRVTMPCPTGH